MISLQALVDAGHSVIVIEHQMDIIKCADYIIDIGLEGGKNGGNVVFAGLPEDLVKVKDSQTSRFFKRKTLTPNS